MRPDALVLGSAGASATVGRVEVVGADAHVHLSLAGGGQVVARVPVSARPRPGDRVRVTVSPSDIHVFDAHTGARVER